MTTPLEATVDWEREGERVGELLDQYCAAAVVGEDAEAAARAALGIARVQARRRRVAVADLVGEVPPLQELVPEDMPHGLVDSFLYGVSLNRIALPIDPAENLFVLPSGAPPVDSTEILASHRWRRLAAGFHEIGALLLVVVPASAEGIETLLGAMDGVVTVGEASLAGNAPVLAAVTAPAGEQAGPTAPAPALSAVRGAGSPASGAERHPAGAPSLGAPAAAAWRAVPRWLVPSGGALAVAAVLLLLVWRGRAASHSEPQTPVAARADSFAEPAAPTESAAGTLSTAPADSVADAADTARSSPFVVVLANLNDSSSAVGKATALVRRAPVPTMSRARVGGATWYRVTAGSYRTAAGADSLLQSLRQRRLLGPQDGYVHRAPFSIKVTPQPVSADTAHALADRLRADGWPVFGLVQPGRRTILYVGAFETPGQAASQMSSLRRDSVALSVGLRIGSVF